MGGMFDPNGQGYNFISKITNLIILNLLWVVCSLPLVTAGAAMTALYTVVLKMARDEEGSIVKTFFKAFGRNFKQATGIWMGLLLYFLLVAGQLLFFIRVGQHTAKLLIVPIALFALVGLMVLTYVFPVLAYFTGSVKTTVKNAVLMSLAHFPQTVKMLLINAAPFFILWFFSAFLSIASFADVVFVFAGCAYLNACTLRNIFENYMPKTALEAVEA